MSPRFEKRASAAVLARWRRRRGRSSRLLRRRPADRWYSHGYELWSSSLSSRSAPSFPAAKTKSVFAHAADLIALAMALFGDGPPKLPLTMSAPFAQAYVIAWMMSASVRPPLASAARSGMIETSQLTPVTPIALLPCAPIVPATCVPWPLKSSGVLSSCTKSQPRVSSTLPFPSLSPPPAGSSLIQMFGARSGCV